jgi:hypothetical protein
MNTNDETGYALAGERFFLSLGFPGLELQELVYFWPKI